MPVANIREFLLPPHTDTIDYTSYLGAEVKLFVYDILIYQPVGLSLNKIFFIFTSAYTFITYILIRMVIENKF